MSMEPFRVIHLTQRMSTIVDPEDYDRASQHKWFARYDKKSRVFRVLGNIRDETEKWRTVHFPRFLTSPQQGLQVDHINHDPLDNRRLNLRVCTAAQNKWNTGKQRSNISGFKGINWNAACQSYQARITVHGVTYSLGYYKDKIMAAKAYDEAAKKYHGEFAKLNFGDE